MTRQPTDYSAVFDEISNATMKVQTDLRTCLDAVLPQLDGARACARALGLRRQLGWRAYTVATSSDVPTLLSALPRRVGWDMIVAALRKRRCPEDNLKALAASIDALLQPLDSGRINRTLLRAMAAGRLDNARATGAMLRARRTAREGSARIYGVQCRGQLGTYVIGPASEDGWVDIVTVMSYDDLQRLRPGPAVPVKTVNRMWHATWEESRTSTPLGLDAGPGGLVEDLSTPDVRKRHLRVTTREDKSVVNFEGGGTTLAPPVRLVFAEHIARGGTVGQSDDRVDLLLAVSVPGEFCVFEAWLHRSLRRLTDPVASMQGPMGSFAGMISVEPLPLEAQAEEVEKATLPRRLRPFGAIHAQAVDRAARVLGAELSEFVGFRVVVPDPPIGSRICLTWRM